MSLISANQKPPTGRGSAVFYFLLGLGGARAGVGQAVRRNSDRFPTDFMFVLDQTEFGNWRSQIVISSSDRMGLRYPPMAFTEQGLAMLSSVLRSKRAIAVDVQIMRTFVRLRQMLSSNAELAKKLADLEKRYDRQFSVVFDAIHQLMTPSEPKREQIGFASTRK